MNIITLIKFPLNLLGSLAFKTTNNTLEIKIKISNPFFPSKFALRSQEESSGLSLCQDDELQCTTCKINNAKAISFH